MTTQQLTTTPPGPRPSGRPVGSAGRLFEQLLEECVARGASDLHIAPRTPPTARIDGHLLGLSEAAWGADACEAFCRAITPDRYWSELQDLGTTDFAVGHASGDRFRVNVMRQRSGIGAVLRRVSGRLLTFEEIGVPLVVTNLLQRSRGLVLVTGPTGAGKSTTLATMVDWVNTHYDRHVVTIEGPIEFVHENRRGLVTQREVGRDVSSFPEAVRRALRQDPDVIMLGEMRDPETITAALTAAETGHLVLGTFHTTGAANTVSRVVDAFPAHQQPRIRVQLAMSLGGIISQVLVPAMRPSGPHPDLRPRVAALEVMINTPAIADLIRSDEVNRITDVIQTSGEKGMFTLDDHLCRLVGERAVSREDALAAALDPAMVDRRLEGT